MRLVVTGGCATNVGARTMYDTHKYFYVEKGLGLPQADQSRRVIWSVFIVVIVLAVCQGIVYSVNAMLMIGTQTNYW